MRVSILIRSYSSSCFIFCERNSDFVSSVWFYVGFFQEEKWWHGTTETESHAADRGQGGGCVSVCHVINFVGVSQSVMISHWKYQTPYSHKQIFVQSCSFLLQPSLMEFFISKQWINKFNTFAEPGPISNDDFLCKHGGNLSICFC